MEGQRMPATILSPQAVINGLWRRRKAPGITQRGALHARRLSLFPAFELFVAQTPSQSPRAKLNFRRPPWGEIGGAAV